MYFFFRFRNIKVPPDWFLGVGVVAKVAGRVAVFCRICRNMILIPEIPGAGLEGEVPCRNRSNHLQSSHHHKI